MLLWFSEGGRSVKASSRSGGKDCAFLFIMMKECAYDSRAILLPRAWITAMDISYFLTQPFLSTQPIHLKPPGRIFTPFSHEEEKV